MRTRSQVSAATNRDVERWGDVTVTIHDKSPPTRIRVSSKSLRQSSPVFCTMLRSSFVEGTTFQTTGSTDINVHDTDSDAMFYFMKAIHGLKPWIEKDEVTLNRLYDIAFLADKYSVPSKYFQSSMVEEFCLENCPVERVRPAHEKLMGQYLFVAMILGLSKIFPELTRRAIVEAPVHFDGHPVLRLLAGTSGGGLFSPSFSVSSVVGTWKPVLNHRRADFINARGISIQKPFLQYMRGSVGMLSNAKNWANCKTPCRERQQARLDESLRVLQRGSLDSPVALGKTSVGALNRELRLIHREACSACEYFSTAFRAQKYLDESVKGAELQAFRNCLQQGGVGPLDAVVMQEYPGLPYPWYWKVSPEAMGS